MPASTCFYPVEAGMARDVHQSSLDPTATGGLGVEGWSLFLSVQRPSIEKMQKDAGWAKRTTNPASDGESGGSPSQVETSCSPVWGHFLGVGFQLL